MSKFHALSLFAIGSQKEKMEVESNLESAIARPAVVHQGVKATESQKENKILGQKKLRAVLSLKIP